MTQQPSLQKPKANGYTMHLVIDRWQLALDTRNADGPFRGTPAVMFSSFDFEEAWQRWMDLNGPANDNNPERKRYALVQVTADVT